MCSIKVSSVAKDVSVLSIIYSWDLFFQQWELCAVQVHQQLQQLGAFYKLETQQCHPSPR
jgi:hypothetical protein